MRNNDLELYCKMLTDKYVALERQYNTLKERHTASEARHKKKYATMEKEFQKQVEANRALRQTNTDLKKEIQHTDVYKKLLQEVKHLKSRIKHLEESRDRLIGQLNFYNNNNTQ